MTMWCYKVFFFFLAASVASARRPKSEPMHSVYLGGLFDGNPDDHLSAEEVNDFLNTISTERQLSVKFLAETVDSGNSFDAMLKTCSFLEQRTAAIFGPKNEENIITVKSICDYKEVAHVVTRWLYDLNEYKSIISFYPTAESLTVAYYTILNAWQWKSFTVFYEDNESLLRVSDLVRKAKNSGMVVVLKQLTEVEDDTNYRKSLKEGLQSGETNYVIDCRIEILEEVLIQLQQVGMMTSYFKYFITNLDLDTIDLEPFQYSDANITGLKLVNPTREVLTEYGFSVVEKFTMKTERALLYDALMSVVRAINKLPAVTNLERNMSCSSPDNLRHGTSLANEIIMETRHDGLTGMIEFDNARRRNNFDLVILELHEDGVHEIGNWNMSAGLKTIRRIGEDFDDDPFSLRNRTFKVITCLTDPYGMLKETSEPLFGNDRFEGFGIDLIHELSVMEGFNYTFIIREDKSNGKKQPDGSWSGMIGDLIAHEADLAITDLTITAEREQAVDFTSPFMNLGISILAKVPKNAPPGFFSFADPFALDTWIMLAVAYVIVSLSFFIMGRLCPDEWTNPYPCIEEPEFLINQFSFKNSFWFAVGSLMQQGSEVAPIAISTRMVSGMWWFFVLIMVSSYTANLAAFLATENPINLFTDLDSLVANMEKYNIRIGAKLGGATASFFELIQFLLHQRTRQSSILTKPLGIKSG